MLLARGDINTELAKRQLQSLNLDHVTLPPDLLLCLGLSSKKSLHLAAQSGDTDAVLSLLHKPHLQLNSHFGRFQTTALHEAALNGHVDIVEALLRHADVDVNSIDCDGRTALMHAASKGHSDIVKMFLQHPKIAVNHRSEIGWTALTEAVDEGYTEAVRLLLAHKDIDIGASRVAEPGFWDLKLDDWITMRKHMTLPVDLRLRLGLHSSSEVTEFEK
jgi:ankyrin repeat protein